MVRLIPYESHFPPSSHSEFQSHYGSINTQSEIDAYNSSVLFQSHYGSINTNCNTYEPKFRYVISIPLWFD